jgi:Holliday junction resolvase RusA-like endonuclease
MKLIIPGEPTAKSRPRVTRYGAYTPKKTVNYETLVKELYSINNFPKLSGQLRIEIKAYFTIPKSASALKRIMMSTGQIRPVKRPDLDNLIKIIADALNTIAYDDDSQIVTAIAEKYYSYLPRVEVNIEEE